MQAMYPHNRMFNDIVFEGRNKTYGAFFLRHLHSRNMVIAIFFSLAVVLMLVNIPGLLKLLKGYLPESSVEVAMTPITLEPPPLTPIVRPRAMREPPMHHPAPRKAAPSIPTVVDDDEPEIEAPIESFAAPESMTTGSASSEGALNAPEGEYTGDAPVSGAIIEGETTSHIFTFVEQMPEFQDGYPGLIRYLQRNLRYPAVARENNISGKVIIQFVVTAQGKIKNAIVVRGIGGGCDQEALRVVMGMPDWKPGKHNGRAVPVTFTLPISFELK